MGLLNLFSKKERKKNIPIVQKNEKNIIHDWEELPQWVPIESNDQTPIGVISCAIAAQNQPKSQYNIIRIQQRNPEFERTALIASSLATLIFQHPNWCIKSIKTKKNTE